MLEIGNDLSIAEQIASLLNQHNSLTKQYQAGDIIAARARYHPVTLGGHVLASVAIDKLNLFLTEIKHLVVLPKFRNVGIGRHMLKVAIERTRTPYVVATVRSDNHGSLKIFTAAGFNSLAEISSNDHKVQLLGRATDVVLHTVKHDQAKESQPSSNH